MACSVARIVFSKEVVGALGFPHELHRNKNYISRKPPRKIKCNKLMKAISIVAR